MTLYLDTSLFDAALTADAATPSTQIWFAEQNADALAISDCVATEFSADLSIKLRTGQLMIGQRADALAIFAQLSATVSRL